MSFVVNCLWFEPFSTFSPSKFALLPQLPLITCGGIQSNIGHTRYQLYCFFTLTRDLFAVIRYSHCQS